MSSKNASVVAVQDGTIVKLGRSKKLGLYVVLRDIYGDVFTYAGLGSIARTYTPPKASPTAGESGAGTSKSESTARSAYPGDQLPLTLKVSAPIASSTSAGAGKPAGTAPASASTPAGLGGTGLGKVRLFAHPNNPDALVARAAARADEIARRSARDHRLLLRVGTEVAQGTVLGHVRVPPAAKDGHIRFAIRPAGDPETIAPGPILENWTQLDAALHPQGAKGEEELLGATASGVFLLSKSQLERDILSDPGIVMSACSRQEVASGALDKRVLAVLAFLSRSGLKPTVGTLPCGNGAYAAAGFVSPGHSGDALAISHINGVPIAGHQGRGSITDTTIRTLLTLRGQYLPHQIVSLMYYPGAPITLARADHGGYIEIAFPLARRHAPSVRPSLVKPAHSAGAGRTAPSPFALSGELTAAQWGQLIDRIAVLPTPTVAAKPSSAAIPDRPATSSPAASSPSRPATSSPATSGSRPAATK
jgi:hypothetical protein